MPNTEHDLNNASQLIEEIADKYSLDYNDSYKIVVDAISEAYTAYSVILDTDGFYASYQEESGTIKFVKLKYSQAKMKQIISIIQDNSNKLYLLKQRDKMISFLKKRKNYLYSTYLYTKGSEDYYELYYDYLHTKKLKNIIASHPTSKDHNKTRFYIDFTTMQYVDGFISFKEHKSYINLKNLKAFTRDVSSEVFKKINHRIWIDVKSFHLRRKKVYIHIPYKTTKEILSFIDMKFKEIFGLKIELIYEKQNSKKDN